MNKLAVAALAAGGLAVSMSGFADAPSNPYGDTQSWNSCNDTNRYGYDVRTVQEQLICLGYNPGPVDGCMGSRTRSAVKQYQRDNALSVDGVVGNETGSSLAAAYQRCIAPPPAPVVVAPPPAPVVVIPPAPAPVVPVDMGQATFNWFVEGGYAADINADPLPAAGLDDFKAGDGIYGNLGFVIGHTKSALSAMLSVGYKYNEDDVAGTDYEFRTVPVNFVLFYNWERTRLGLGVTYKINPDFVINDVNDDGSNESGPMARLDYFVTRGLYLGAQFESIEYDANAGTPGNDGDADNVGIHLGYEF